MSKKSSTVSYILYSYVDKGHRFLFSRLANSLKKCLDNYTMHTERINGENISVNIVVNGSSLFVDFFLCKDFNFIMINEKFTIHDTLLFAFLYFE